MLNFLKSIFTAEERPLQLEQSPLGELADVKQLPDGSFAVITKNGLEATYTRRRDAVRGATRRGFTVTNTNV